MPISPPENLPRPNCQLNRCVPNWRGFIPQKSSILINQALTDGFTGHLTPFPAWRFEPGKCEETLLAHFKASTLEGFGLKGQSLAIRASGSNHPISQRNSARFSKSTERIPLLQSERIHDAGRFDAAQP